ncbi:MAG: phosphate ABC transporter permease subunit PstC [Marmoricola sp.]
MSAVTRTTESPRTGSRSRALGDPAFAGLTRTAALLILAALAGVAIFLTLQGIAGFTAPTDALAGHTTFVGYVWPLVFGTVLAAVLALLIAVPLSIGLALAVSHIAPPRIASAVSALVDLLAAVPSVVYGLWGIGFLGPHLVPMYAWLNARLGSIPLFAGPVSTTGRTMLTAGLVLAVMVVPITTAISREVFARTPRLTEEAALALGATRWETIRTVVLPHGRSGVVSAAMLGLGRALGETMAVAMVLSASGVVTFHLISSTNPSTIAANIALTFADATGLQINALIATGLVLFVLTLVVNAAARAVVVRSEETAP